MNNRATPNISIIIVNWNTKELLRTCLSSIGATVNTTHETIIVDNNSDDGSAEMVEASFPETSLIRAGRNLGFAAANNLGINKASGRYVLLLNPDCELLPGSIDTMIEYADRNPDIAVIGPKLLNSDGTLQKNGRIFPTFAREFLHITRLYRLLPGYFNRRLEWGRQDFDIPADVDEVSGACMLVRESMIAQVGGLDERFFMYYEEVDWCKRIKAHGGRVFYLPEAQVVHHHSQSAGKIGIEKNRLAYESQYLYFLKHHGRAQAVTLRAISNAILFVKGAGARR
jgi:hypothetical protein